MGRMVAWTAGCLLSACSPQAPLRGESAGASDSAGLAASMAMPATPPAVTESAQALPRAAFTGDAQDRELEVLDLTYADPATAVGEADDFLLSLPGSSGLVVDAAADLIATGATSEGTPQAGRLSRGVALPANPQLYTRRNPARSFGSTQTIRTIQTALSTARVDKGVRAEIMIGDISQLGGGPISPHVSHQSGRDIDIRLVLARGWDRTTIPVDPNTVDWDATWSIVESFMETGNVTYVFLDFERQAMLRRAALRAGVHAVVAEQWFQWPDRGGPGIIRHEDGHRAHVHIRLACGQGEPGCQGG